MWQPIETAPKDGTKLLLVWREKSPRSLPFVIEGQWHVARDGDEFWWSPSPMRWAVEPTHWMPLPDLPPINK